MKKRIFAGWIALLPALAGVLAQQTTDSVFRFSLAEARAYSFIHSPVMKNAELDVKAARKKVWETTAIGLPQVNAKGSYSYMLTVPKTIEDFSAFSQLNGVLYGFGQNLSGLNQSVNGINQQLGLPAPPINADYSYLTPPAESEFDIDDLKETITLDITVTQLIFSGAYLVGLQTARTFKGLSQLALTKSRTDLAESITNSYYLVLVVRENKATTDSIYVSIQKNVAESEALLAQGFIDETTVDQIRLAASNIKSLADMLSRQATITENLLKYQLGIDPQNKIELTETIDDLLAKQSLSLATKEFSLSDNIDYRLLETQEKLMRLNLKHKQSEFLPEIAGYYNHQENYNDKSFTFTPPDMVGVSINIPIFGSGMKMAKVSQAKIQYQQAKNTKEHTADALKIAFDDAKSSFLSSYEKYETEKKNMQLSRRIYNQTLIKYKEGIASGMELTQAQNQYFNTQASYYAAIIAMVNSSAKLEKLITDNK